MDPNSLNPEVHMLSACKLLSDTEIRQILDTLDCDKCIQDSDTMTYYFYVRK